MMWVTGIDHVQLAMPAGREADARAFYSGLLGIPEVPKPPALAERGGVWFEGESVRVHLGIDETSRPATKAHPAFVTANLARIEEYLQSAGVPITGDHLAGYERIYVSDPFGNRIELMEPRDTNSELRQTISRMEDRFRQRSDDRSAELIAMYDALCRRFSTDLRSERDELFSRGGALMLIQEIVSHSSDRR
jgi:catechol 2,3-dioxygenase-like lactoylglutathione lyase family enzyme